jgi:hypothetical protein
VRRLGATVFLFWAYLLFMWMFFTTEAFKNDVLLAHRSGVLNAEQLKHGLRLGSAWRHGMAGGWPVFLPGFFLLSLALVWWSNGRSGRGRWIEAGGLLLGATICAVALTRYGQAVLANLFERDLGVVLAGAVLDLKNLGVGPALLTAGAWTSCMLLAVHAIELRRPRIMLLALIPYAALYVARPGAAEQLNREWAGRVMLGEPAAILTLALIPVMAVGIFWAARSSRR